jgi:SAM-dependent methyltransferase
MEKAHNYLSYDDYINFQKIKTTDPRRRKKWLNEEWQLKIDIFKRLFNDNNQLLSNCNNALCLGARTGQEVVALQSFGIEALGIDIVECPPLVIKGDIHDLQFKDESYDLVFSNIFDHSLYPEKFISEIERVLKKNGLCIMHFQIDTHQDQFTEVIIRDFNSVLKLFKNCELISRKQIESDLIAMNYEIILKKK